MWCICEVRASQPVWTWNRQFPCYWPRVTGLRTLPTFLLDALVFFRAKVEVSTMGCPFIAAHKPSLGVTGSHGLPLEVTVWPPVDRPITALQCSHPTLGSVLDPLQLWQSLHWWDQAEAGNQAEGTPRCMPNPVSVEVCSCRAHLGKPPSHQLEGNIGDRPGQATWGTCWKKSSTSRRPLLGNASTGMGRREFPIVGRQHCSAVRGRPTGGQTSTSGSKPWLPVTPNDGLCATING